MTTYLYKNEIIEVEDIKPGDAACSTVKSSSEKCINRKANEQCLGKYEHYCIINLLKCGDIKIIKTSQSEDIMFHSIF
jgi:hypothetical protein